MGDDCKAKMQKVDISCEKYGGEWGVFRNFMYTCGVNFTTGLVLTYDNMPTLMAPLTIAEDGKVGIGELSECEE